VFSFQCHSCGRYLEVQTKLFQCTMRHIGVGEHLRCPTNGMYEENFVLILKDKCPSCRLYNIAVIKKGMFVGVKNVMEEFNAEDYYVIQEESFGEFISHRVIDKEYTSVW
jgi:hypothetical protein